MHTRRIGGLLTLVLSAVVAAPAVGAAPRATPPVAASFQQQADGGASPAPAAARTTTGVVVAHATYGLGFGRPAAIVPPGAAASGAASPGQYVVTALRVSVGDVVTRGDVLASADNAAALGQMEAARTARDAAQATLERDLARPTADDRARSDASVQQARVAVAAARRAWRDARAQGRATVRAARLAITLAEDAYRQDVRAGAAAPVVAADRRAILTARAALTTAAATARASDHKAADAVRTAGAALRVATVARRAAVAKAAPEVIAADRAALAKAEAALTAAQAALSGTLILAPADGIVSAIALEVGVAAPAGDAIVVREGPLEVIVQVPEAEVTSFTVGQQVTVTVDALGLSVTGSIASVGLAPSSAAGDPAVRYPVTIALDVPPDAVRVGMTATVVLPGT
jgi:multidrug resistance efflux pump